MKFVLKAFKLQLDDDSNIKSEQSGSLIDDDPFSEYRQTKIELYSTNLFLTFDHFDNEDLKNKNQGELKVNLQNLGIDFIEIYEDKESRKKKLITQQHRVMWKQNKNQLSHFIDL